MRSPILITIALISLLDGGCAVGTNYKSPNSNSAPVFGEINATVNTNEPVADWWREFHDDELDHLVVEALRQNFDLQIAAMRIQESRFQRAVVAADLFPKVNADGSYSHSRGSKNVVLPLGGSGSGSGSQSSDPPAASKTALAPQEEAVASESANTDSGGGSSNPAPSPLGQGGLPGVTSDLYQVGFDAAWEIDVFGGQRRRVEAASADFEAVAQSRHDMQVTVAAEVARNYLDLRGTQERLKIARANLAAQNEILALTRSKLDVGLVTESDVKRVMSEADLTAANLPPLEAGSRRLIHALSILVGKEPIELSAELSGARPLPPIPPQVPVGLPSELVKRRADIRQAERQIAAANARIGAAQAELFPKFELIGSAGLDSTSPANLFDWESRYFLISPTVTWRIFDAGRVLGNIKLQRANEREADLQYHGALLKALREVEDALVTYATEQTRRNHLADAMRQSHDVLDLAKKRYEQGLADFLTVLDAERSAYSAEDAYAESSQSVTTALVALYKSLGGGWN